MMTNSAVNRDLEAQALAACYRLLLQKAAERRARLAGETAVTLDEQNESLAIENWESGNMGLPMVN